MLKSLPKILHKRGGRGVVALRFCTFVVGFIDKAWFYSPCLGLLFSIVQALPCLSSQVVLSSWLGHSCPFRVPNSPPSLLNWRVWFAYAMMFYCSYCTLVLFSLRGFSVYINKV